MAVRRAVFAVQNVTVGVLFYSNKQWKRLIDCLRGSLSNYKGWIAQMKERWCGNPEVSGSCPGPVKFSLPIFQSLFYSLERG